MSRSLFRETLFRHCRANVRSSNPVILSSPICRVSTSSRITRTSLFGLIGAVSVGGASLWALYRYTKRRGLFQSVLPLLRAKEEESEVVKPSRKERRFKDFASCSYHGEPYMTARDFLESVTLVRPRGGGGRERVCQMGEAEGGVSGMADECTTLCVMSV